MNLLIISDLHIGTNDRFDTFGWNTHEFLGIIERIRQKEKIDRIVLNGDIFELYKYAFDDVVRNNPTFMEFLSRPDVDYIKGNHDALCNIGCDHICIENRQGQKIYIEHGHSADFLNGSRFGRQLQTWGFNVLKRLINFNWFRNFYFRIIELDDAINHIPKKYDSYKYLSHALKLLKTYDMVILGHTHKIESHKTYYLNHKKQYINSGSCSMGRFQGILVNTESLKYETLKFKNIKEFNKEYPQTPLKVWAIGA